MGTCCCREEFNPTFSESSSSLSLPSAGISLTPAFVEVGTRTPSLPPAENIEERMARAFKQIRSPIFGDSIDSEAVNRFQKVVIPKEASSIEFILHSLKSYYLFLGLESSQILDMANAMSPLICSVGKNVVVQGENGSYMYLVHTGLYECVQNGEVVKQFTSGQCFGELALLFDEPRVATIRCTSPGVLWSLDRHAFRYTLAYHSRKVPGIVQRIISEIPLFRDVVSPMELAELSSKVELAQYRSGSTIIERGDEGRMFYVIKEGIVTCQNTGDADHSLDLQMGEFFGERSMLLGEPRATTVTAKTDVTCLLFNDESFNMIKSKLEIKLEEYLSTWVVKSHLALAHLLPQDKTEIIQSFRISHFPSGSIICNEKESATQCILIVRGSFKSTLHNNPYELSNKRTVNISMFSPNSSPLNECTIEATSTCKTMVLEKNVIDRIQKRYEGRATDNTVNKSYVSPLASKSTSMQDFDVVKTLGVGSFGRVKLAHHRITKELYAIKILSKMKLRQEKNVMNERTLLGSCSHPFIQELYCTFQDRNCLYMVSRFYQGGELYNYLWTQGGSLPVQSARFYAASVHLALSYLHEKKIIYRDLKPENIMISDSGYIRIIDFGFAKRIYDSTFTLCGTPEYIAPEIILGNGYSFPIDYWALGIMIYEMIVGYSPFSDRQHHQQAVVCKNILRGNYSFPDNITDTTFKDIVRSLLSQTPSERLGKNQNDIERHPWFFGFNFKGLFAKTVAPPFVPKFASSTDTHLFYNPAPEKPVAPFFGDDSWCANF